ncbi:thaumatin family-domain-containing protein [Leucosporidium creatinivorum]|uniref:Thaumatin family-domain-containing protein n=1 Tax=Leucosporidium creatinivorum TaxID=106004 RepID=A0A1Y2FWA6_9BASI|nr:thaumatin family-domain-containing protein [Leucosporidium creatinivorum]
MRCTTLLRSPATAKATHAPPPLASRYSYFIPYATKWTDNDVYSHLNNSEYTRYFDSTINAFLINYVGMPLPGTPSSTSTTLPIGLAVHSSTTFSSSLSYPNPIVCAVGVQAMGRSSVTWEAALFEGTRTMLTFNPSSSLVALALLAVAPLGVEAKRLITVTNNCAYNIWPAIYTSSGTAPSLTAGTGWEQKSKAKINMGRTGCDFSTKSNLPSTCLTGGCNGGLACNLVGGTGVPPATLAEFAMGAGGDADWYDISLVDGFNIPMSITNNKNCTEPACSVDINKICPSKLRVKNGLKTKTYGCLTSCSAGLWKGKGGNANSPYCCSGDYDTPETCPHTGVLYYDTFKVTCPMAYAYAYDESSGQSPLYTCPTKKMASYTVTFCPST